MQGDCIKSRWFCCSFTKKEGSSSSTAKVATPARALIVVFLTLFLTGLMYSRWVNTSIIEGLFNTSSVRSAISSQRPKPELVPLPPFRCATNFTCPPPPSPSPTPPLLANNEPTFSCPDYFRWIHEDLKPWKQTGITKEMVERTRNTSHFRLVVVDGRAYVDTYGRPYQTRDVLNQWGIVQLLRKYPGRVPDLDLMFDCEDRPFIKAADFLKAPPTPVFKYCKDDATLDIVFPDWSFWGWPQINIKPWVPLLKELMEGNKRIKWVNREPYAYWKGNPTVSPNRPGLLRCNVSDKQDWNARLFHNDWLSETRQGFKNSNLADQCYYRYKIYIEGLAWSVSEKYILACDSPTLLITPHYYDFFTRGLMPMQHYWPIREDAKCESIKFAVDWGNSHEQEAQHMGKEASDFIREKLDMDNIYDYMFHLLNEYSKLLRYKPTIPPKAVEFCAESMACNAEGRVKESMMQSMVNSSQISSPCTLPPPFDDREIRSLLAKKASAIKQVETWERRGH